MDEALIILRRYALGIWRRRWIWFCTAWVICLAGWLGVMSLPAIYEADAEVAVAPESSLAPFLHGIMVGDNANHEAALLLQYTLLSRPSLKALIAKEHLLRARETPEALALLESKLARTVQIVPVTTNLGSQQMSRLFIKYRDSDPKRAYAVVNGLLNVFIDQTIQSDRADLADAKNFFDGQIASYRNQLHDLEQRRAVFVAKYGQLLPGAKGTPSELDLARANVHSLETSLQDKEVQVAFLRREVERAPKELASGSNSADPRAHALMAAEEHLAELRQRYTDAYPGVIEARRLVAALARGKGPVGSQGHGLPNPLFEKLELQLLDAQAKQIMVRSALQVATAEVDRLRALANANPKLMARYAGLDREYKAVRKQYSQLLSRRASMRVNSAETANTQALRLKIVNPPQLPVVPVAPRRRLLLGGVLLAGIGGGAMAAFAMTYADTRVYTVRQLQDIGLPVIGVISLRQGAESHRQALHFLGFGAAIVASVIASAYVITLGTHLGWHP